MKKRNLDESVLKMDDVSYVTIALAAKMCDINIHNFYRYLYKFTIVEFANIKFIEYEEIKKFADYRKYNLELKNKNKKND